MMYSPLNGNYMYMYSVVHVPSAPSVQTTGCATALVYTQHMCMQGPFTKIMNNESHNTCVPHHVGKSLWNKKKGEDEKSIGLSSTDWYHAQLALTVDMQPQCRLCALSYPGLLTLSSHVPFSAG